MAERNDIDVFLSYHHADRARVKPLVDLMKASGWAVWWDTEVSVGARWRDLLLDRLEHARVVCVVWTSGSVASDFVRDEASRANARGVLLPVRLEDVRQPLGFGEIHTIDVFPEHDLAALSRPLLHHMQALIDGGRDVAGWSTDIDTDYSVTRTAEGIEEARLFLQRVRTLSDMLKANPGAASGLRSALAGVRDTYVAVGHAIDGFLAPARDHHAAIDRTAFLELADGRILAKIERDGGHCKRIAQVYVESGGLRESLPPGLSPDLRDDIDELILSLSSADSDLFKAMAAIGRTLETQAAVVTNLLLAGQDEEARSRLVHAERILLPLRQDVNRGMADVERVSAELGVGLS
jgi:TIR domain